MFPVLEFQHVAGDAAGFASCWKVSAVVQVKPWVNTPVVTQGRGQRKVVVAQARSSARNLLTMDVGNTTPAKVRFSREK